ncbi:MAG: NAD-dependent epimerase/dehydratase family protein [Acidimicrobiales bacterium]|nr:NAD-dependent epimerase/dehydratase family protein [Acidimicrobiales bacterium]HRW37379.1 NAD-dependent epimerase/dehydratase family protein [Aquihabitans sp.]
MLTLVTGGAGFIGSNLADALIAEGHEVRILDDLSTGFAENLPAASTFFEGDLCDAELVAEAVEGVEVVFHQGARGSVPKSIETPLLTDRSNVLGTLTVLDAAHRAGVRRVVAASSSSVYGGVAPRPTVETSPLSPKSPYAASKVAAELYLRVYWELHGLETVALRYFNVYGPRQDPNGPYAAVIPRFIAALRAGEAPQVNGDGGQSRDFAFVADVVAANLAAATAPASACAGKAYNVAGGSERSLLEMLEILGSILGTDIAPEHLDPRPGDVRHSFADTSAAAADLGWAPVTDFADGLRATADWFR